MALKEALDGNGTILKICVVVLAAVIIGWISWVSNGIVTGKSEREGARIDRAYICKNIEEIKQGIKHLTDYFMIPKPGK